MPIRVCKARVFGLSGGRHVEDRTVLTIAARLQGHTAFPHTAGGWLATWWVWALALTVLLVSAVWVLVHDDDLG
jgi:hypothetical protein